MKTKPEPLIAAIKKFPPLQKADNERLARRVQKLNAELRAILKQLQTVANDGGENSGTM